jgi:hypothetical protein
MMSLHKVWTAPRSEACDTRPYPYIERRLGSTPLASRFAENLMFRARVPLRAGLFDVILEVVALRVI